MTKDRFAKLGNPKKPDRLKNSELKRSRQQLLDNPMEEETVKSLEKLKQLITETQDEVIAKKVIKHADILSVLQYCQNEETLGNKNFTELRKATEKRVNNSRKELELLISQSKKEDN